MKRLFWITFWVTIAGISAVALLCIACLILAILEGLAGESMVVHCGKMFLTEERVVYIGKVLTIFTLINGCGFIFTIFFGGEPDFHSKTAKPEKVAIPFKSYDVLKAHIETLTACWNYTYSRAHPLDEGKISIYIHSNGLSGIDCIVLVRVPELHQENRNQIDEAIHNLLTAYYGKETLNDFISMIEFFCVDRITPSFHSTLNHVKWKDYKFEYFPAGVSFGGKNAYIAVPSKRSKRYENMREVILRLLGTEVEER